MIKRLFNAVSKFKSGNNSTLTNNSNNGKTIYYQNDQEFLDTLRMYLTTEIYRELYYKHSGDYSSLLKEERFIDDLHDNAHKVPYLKQSDRIEEILNHQVLELFENVHSVGGKNSYPPPLKNNSLLYRSMEEKVKRCLLIKETHNQGEPIEHPRGFKLHIKPSIVDHQEAGYGVHVEGTIFPGTVVALYPGHTYDGNILPPQVIMDNDYMIARYDGTVIDGRGWTKKAEELMLKNELHKALGSTGGRHNDLLKFKNPFAIGNFINHPPKGARPNVLAYNYNFKRNFPDHLKPYIPNHIATEDKTFKDDSLFLRSLILVALEPIQDTELFLNYRFNPANKYPSWYSQPDIEEANRRWGEREKLSLRSILMRIK